MKETNIVWFLCVNSILGGFLIIAGLYLVTWACYRERQAAVGINHVNRDSEPLIDEEEPQPQPLKTSYHRGHMFSGSSIVLPRPWVEVHES